MYYSDEEKIINIIFEQIRTYDRVVEELLKLVSVAKDVDECKRYNQIAHNELKKIEACNDILDRIKHEVYNIQD